MHERVDSSTAVGRIAMISPTVPKPDLSQELADDLLRGADEIAEFIFGNRSHRRKVYYLAECTRLPLFRLGSVLCARRSVLLNWISGQEGRAYPAEIKQPNDVRIEWGSQERLATSTASSYEKSMNARMADVSPRKNVRSGR
jgi:hypothetical protein